MTSNEVNEIDAIDPETISFDYTEFTGERKQQFQRVHATDLTYKDFFVDYMSANKPVIISGITDRWECMNWTHQNTINFSYLRERIDTSSNVPVANCNQLYFNSHDKLEMVFGDFLDYWQRRIEGSDDDNLYYLKDWHLQRFMPSYQFYETPVYFTSDWLNEFCLKSNCDDYRFVYMGPKGTWTPFHSDVFSSFSWSTNIVGVKRWLFFAPGEELKLRDAFGNFPLDLDEATIERSQASCIEIIQGAGETIFAPSGWHHQVYNMGDTISVNHNWFNGCNVHAVWTALKRSYHEVLNEIADCRDMDDFDGHCQLMLKSVFGLNFETFLDILCCVAETRINLLKKDHLQLDYAHNIFDLKAIGGVLNDLKKTEYEVKQMERIENLIVCIENIM